MTHAPYQPMTTAYLQSLADATRAEIRRALWCCPERRRCCRSDAEIAADCRDLAEHLEDRMANNSERCGHPAAVVADHRARAEAMRRIAEVMQPTDRLFSTPKTLTDGRLYRPKGRGGAESAR